jgi:hypothetical protein
MALWFLLAIVVFNVRFDWRTRQAGFDFMHAQLARQRQGLAPVSIHDGFRPMVRDAARQAVVWPAAIMLIGSAATMLAARTSR